MAAAGAAGAALATAPGAAELAGGSIFIGVEVVEPELFKAGMMLPKTRQTELPFFAAAVSLLLLLAMVPVEAIVGRGRETPEPAMQPRPGPGIAPPAALPARAPPLILAAEVLAGSCS